MANYENKKKELAAQVTPKHEALQKAKERKSPNQEYRGRVKRFLEAGGDPKYVNVKRKAQARHESYINHEL